MSGYLSGFAREALTQEHARPNVTLNAWSVQNIVYELITNYFLANSPQSCGCSFKQQYDPDPTKATLFVDIAYNWKKATSDKRPAVFIARGDLELKVATMSGDIASDSAESEDTKLVTNTMPIRISCIGTNLGLTEQLAEYTKQPLLYFRREIQRDFKFRQFKLIQITAPKNIVEPSDHFSIELVLQTVFDEGWMVKGDHLKLKTVGKEIFDRLVDKPIQ